MPDDPNKQLAADEDAAQLEFVAELQRRFNAIAAKPEDYKQQVEGEYNNVLGEKYANRTRVMREPGANPELVGDKLGKTSTQWPQIGGDLPHENATGPYPGAYYPFPGENILPGTIVDVAENQGDAIRLHELRHVQNNEPWASGADTTRYTPRDRRAIAASQALYATQNNSQDSHEMHDRLPVSASATGGGNDPDPNGIKRYGVPNAERDIRLAQKVADLRKLLGLK